MENLKAKKIIFVYTSKHLTFSVNCSDALIFDDCIIVKKKDNDLMEKVSRIDTVNKFLLIDNKWLPKKPSNIQFLEIKECGENFCRCKSISEWSRNVDNTYYYKIMMYLRKGVTLENISKNLGLSRYQIDLIIKNPSKEQSIIYGKSLKGGKIK